ncbi:MAG: amidase family protein, partial [Verrucomicrobiales bacterium]
VAPDTAPLLGASKGDPLKAYLADIFTISANLAGIPGISVPLPPAQAGDLPAGLQILGPHMDEHTILRIARTLELTQ